MCGKCGDGDLKPRFLPRTPIVFFFRFSRRLSVSALKWFSLPYTNIPILNPRKSSNSTSGSSAANSSRVDMPVCTDID
jgi:hypothetical protein